MASNLTLKQACEGMIHYKTAAGRSPHTILDYRNTFKKLLLYFPKNPPLVAVTRADLIAFFAWLHDGFETEPDGVAPRGKFKLSAKSILNMHTNLSALWTWLSTRSSSRRISFARLTRLRWRSPTWYRTTKTTSRACSRPAT